MTYEAFYKVIENLGLSVTLNTYNFSQDFLEIHDEAKYFAIIGKGYVCDFQFFGGESATFLNSFDKRALWIACLRLSETPIEER